MNCKPGDLAFVTNTEIEQFLGNVVRVLRPYDGPSIFGDVGAAWWVDYAGDEFHADDSHLRPIRNPGDDAVDEVLQRLPVPHKEMA